jgi:cation diffusion facilitator CzcD-associated flavoprotein CzcO
MAAAQPAAPDHQLAIIGAGLSGIGMAIALRRAGIEDFVIFERADDIGGTWRDNVYPGIAVDVPAQAYQFSYELNPEWSRVFARGDEVKAYIDHCADRYGIRPFVRFEADVQARTWDEDAHLWRLDVNGEEVTARYVVSATGPFIEPKEPGIAGVDEFGGTVLRSASWDRGFDPAGKRIAVIGTGASAVQIVPQLAPAAARLDVYQRTPIWVGPKIDPPTPGAVKELYRRVPVVQRVVHRVATDLVEAGLVTGVVEYHRLKWGGAIAKVLAREVFYRWQVPDAELRAKLTPDYDIGCKRPAVSNTYLRSFTRDDVDLVTDAIESVTPTGVRTVDGTERDVDAIVLATGFHLAFDPEPFERRPVRGRDGFDLAALYRERTPGSYESVSMPGLPNHFMIFGPYGWTGGTWHQLVEVASQHILRVVGEAERRGATAVEVRAEAADAWTAMAEEKLSHSLWREGNCATANSYYFDRHGNTAFLRPTSSRQAFAAAASFPLDDYVYERVPDPSGETVASTAAAG